MQKGAVCSVGDLVFGQATGCLGTAVRGDGRTLVAAPPQLGTAAAAAVPTVYLTADACLRGAAGLKAGQTALIHAATGLLRCHHLLATGQCTLQVLQKAFD